MAEFGKGTPQIGLRFKTPDEAWQFWVAYGRHAGFDVRKRCQQFVCSKEGHRRKGQTDHVTKCFRAETRTVQAFEIETADDSGIRPKAARVGLPSNGWDWDRAQTGPDDEQRHPAIYPSTIFLFNDADTWRWGRGSDSLCRHSGHISLLPSVFSTQEPWNMCRHPGHAAAPPDSSNDSKQMQHSSWPPTLPSVITTGSGR
ncbi:hypothetical protein U9M48_040690 [Paspalum notatum var. saurae]|uniref:FAR1 domain-containing protein n=1 Tax=Paspalum notatum var. saurae TaxID=547442 RepID=A0AAQ3UNZ8_PASNO